MTHVHDRRCVIRDNRGHIRTNCTTPQRIIAYATENARTVRLAKATLAEGDPLRQADDVALEMIFEALRAARTIREGDIVREKGARERDGLWKVEFLTGANLEVAAIVEHPGFEGLPSRRVRRFVNDLVKVVSADGSRVQ